MNNKNIEPAYVKAAYDRREEEWSHIPYNVELDLLELIRNGNVDKIRGKIQKTFPAHNGHLSANPHRQAIYEFVACITLVTRFAVEGGVPMETAYTLSDAYIQSADKTRSREDVHTLYEKMILDFTAKVMHAKRTKKQLSMPVKRCMEYIDKNLHNHISLEELGSSIGRNSAYLCVQFKRETGVPLSTYINREKIEEAKHLLRDTGSQVSEIAMTLAFCSQSYFAKTFKSFTGETPNKYRSKLIINHR